MRIDRHVTEAARTVSTAPKTGVKENGCYDIVPRHSSLGLDAIIALEQLPLRRFLRKCPAVQVAKAFGMPWSHTLCAIQKSDGRRPMAVPMGLTRKGLRHRFGASQPSFRIKAHGVSRNTWGWIQTDASNSTAALWRRMTCRLISTKQLFRTSSLVLRTLAKQIGGVERAAGLRLRLWDQKYREPDIVFLRDRNSSLRHENYWEGADLAIEIVSASLEDRDRDLVAKRIEYAQAGIQEYWIVDPAEETVTVLSLTGDVYSEHGFFGRGDVVTSSLLPELTLPVSRDPGRGLGAL